MKNLSLFLLITILSISWSSGFGQDINMFEVLYDVQCQSSTAQETKQFSVRHKEGFYYTVGYSGSFSGCSGENLPHIARYNQIGEMDWIRSYEEDGTLFDMQFDDQGNIAACGDVIVNDFQKFAILKTDDDGNQIWYRTYDNGEDRNSFARCIIPTKDGSGNFDGYLSVGSVDDGGNLNIFMVKVDEDGLIPSCSSNCKYWQKQFSIPSPGSKGLWVIQNSDGDYVLAAAYQQYLFLTIFDENGNFINSGKYYEVPDEKLSPTSIQQTQDGGYIIVGSNQYGPLCVQSNTNCQSNGFIIKVDDNLNLQWYKKLSAPEDVYSRDVYQRTNGNYMVLSHHNQLSTNEPFTAMTEISQDGSSIIKQRKYKWHLKSRDPYSFCVVNNEEFVISGFSRYLSQPGTPQSLYLEKKRSNLHNSCDETLFPEQELVALNLQISNANPSLNNYSGIHTLSDNQQDLASIKTDNCQFCAIAIPGPVITSSCTGIGSILDAGESDEYGYYKKYQWFKAGVLLPNETSQTLNTTNYGPGAYTVKIKYEDMCNWEESDEVHVYDEPVVTIDYHWSCVSEGDPEYYFTGNLNYNGPFEFLWRVDNGSFNGSIGGLPNSWPNANFTFYNDPGTHKIELYIIQTGGCTTSAIEYIEIKSQAPAVTLDNPVYDCGSTNGTGQYVQLNANLTSGGPDVQYEWTNESGTHNGFSDWTIPNPIFTPGTSSEVCTLRVNNNSCYEVLLTQEIHSFADYNNLQNVYTPQILSFFKEESPLNIHHWITPAPGNQVNQLTLNYNPPPTLTSLPFFQGTNNEWYIDVSNLNIYDPNWNRIEYEVQSKLYDPNTGCSKYAGSNNKLGTIYLYEAPTLTIYDRSVCNYGGTTTLTAEVDFPNYFGFVEIYVDWFDAPPTLGTTTPVYTTGPHVPASNISNYTIPIPSSSTTYYAAIRVYRPQNPAVTSMNHPYITSAVPLNLTVQPVNHNITGWTFNPCPTCSLHSNGYRIYHCENDYPELQIQANVYSTSPSGTEYTIEWKRYNSSLGYFETVSGYPQYFYQTNNFTPSESGYYRASVTDVNTGCGQNSQTIELVDLSPNTDISIPSGNSTGYLCPGQNITISANTSYGSSQTIEWYKVGEPVSIGSGFSYIASNAGQYYYVARQNTYPHCEATSSTMTIATSPALSISAGPFVPGANFQDVIVNVPNPQFHTNFTYHFNGSPILGMPTTNTSHTASGATLHGYWHVTSPGCSPVPDKSNTVKTGYDCVYYTNNLSYGTTYSPNYSFSGQHTISNNEVLEGRIIIQNGADVTFDGVEIVMRSYQGNCAEIVIEPGGKLTIQDAQIISCENTWKGITVQGDNNTRAHGISGELIMTGSNSSISDATIAVYSEDGGRIDLQDGTFSNNTQHVVIGPYTADLHGAVIDNVTFGNLIPEVNCTVSSIFSSNSSYTAVHSKKMIYMEDVKAVEIGTNMGNTFTGTSTTTDAVAIECFEVENINIKKNVFSGSLGTGVYVNGEYNAAFYITIQSNQFGSNAPGAINPTNGIIFKEVTGGLIGDVSLASSGNIFYGLTNGIQFYSINSSSSTSSAVSHNLFDNNTYGIVVAPDVYPITTGLSGQPNSINDPTNTSFQNTIYLDIHCNKIYNNDYGIIGTGKLMDQGSQNNENGNDFSSTNNTDVFFATNPVNPNGPTELYYFTTGLPIVTDASSNTDINYIGYGIGSSSIGLTATSNLTSVCHGSWKREPSFIAKVANDDLKIDVYPNPSSGSFTILIKGEYDQYLLQCWDGIGKKLLERNVQTGSTILNSETWPSGIYYLKVISRDGHASVRQLTKTR